ncbi:hypothetical protein PRUPE_5G141400 [Prunus persica]|uniref:Uncharacterized protein n=1 Tax=Prunus persica TaxID=3760 RepID=A0A251PBS6_PRUPE|nr:hypothetical protein PRUPE_5G141400 [Prunus persica]
MSKNEPPSTIVVTQMKFHHIPSLVSPRIQRMKGAYQLKGFHPWSKIFLCHSFPPRGISSCSSIVSGIFEGRNQTSHRNHLCPASCHSSNGSPCDSTNNQTIHPITLSPISLKPTVSSSTDSSNKSILKATRASRPRHKSGLSYPS